MNWKAILPCAVLSLLLSGASTARGAEYFVSPAGSDSADGLSRAGAFATVGRGFAALGPGDTLTILPGEYFESVEIAGLAGTPEAPVTIRALVPGTVLLRGDVPVGGWEAVEEAPGVFRAPCDGEVHGVADPVVVTVHYPVSDPDEVGQRPGSFFHDGEEGFLYAMTRDGREPEFLVVSRTDAHGIGLRDCRHIVIDGLAFTGFNHVEMRARLGSRTRWGIMALRCENIVIRNCVAFLNSSGICLTGTTASLVEDCLAFANFSHAQGVSNQVMGWGCADTVFRRNTVIGYPGGGGSRDQVTFYNNAGNYNLLEANLAIDGGFMDKGEARNVEVKNNLSTGIRPHYYRDPDASNLSIRYRDPAQAADRFVDPVNHDFRLRADSPLRGQGPEGSDPGPFPWRDEVFFVSPSGDDAAAGNTPAAPWRTIAHAAARARPEDTVYLMAGVYNETLRPARSGEPGRPVRFARYARDRVVLDGAGKLEAGLDFTGLSHLEARGLEVRGFSRAGVLASGGENIVLDRLTVEENGGDAVSATRAGGLEVRNCLLSAADGSGLALAASPGALVLGNIFLEGAPLFRTDEASLDNSWSDRNNYAPGARGPLAVAGERSFRDLDGWRQHLGSGREANSRAVEPGLERTGEGVFFLAGDSPLLGRGPLSGPVGPFLRLVETVPVEVEDVRVHGLTPTTANIEGRVTGAPARVVLEWGEGAETGNRVEGMQEMFHTISLTGLRPGTDYSASMSVEARRTTWRFAGAGVTLPGERTAGPGPAPALTFRTPVARRPFMTWHVSPDGDDGDDGFTPDRPLGTIQEAASRALAGDTVLIHGGVYEETVILRSTGDEGEPLTFRAAPGEVAWITGSDRVRPTAFLVQNKSHIVIDGLRFRDFKSVDSGNRRVITFQRGRNNTVRRCFYDGRVPGGYMNVFLGIGGTPGFLLENCVIMLGMGEGLGISGSPGSVIRHCVFYNNNIRALSSYTMEGANNFRLEHNIFSDVIPGKGGSAFIRMRQFNDLESDHNGYFLRPNRDPAQRPIVEAHQVGDEQVWVARPGSRLGLRINLEELREKYGLEKKSVVGNPGMRVVAELVPRFDDETDFRAARSLWLRTEQHLVEGEFQPLDFDDFFADPAGPMGRSAAGRPIGLDPAAFGSDFGRVSRPAEYRAGKRPGETIRMFRVMPPETLSPARLGREGAKHLFAAGYYTDCRFDFGDRYALALWCSFAGRLPGARDTAVLGVVDTLRDNAFAPLAETRAWNWQMGCKAQWLAGGETAFIHNDRRRGRFVSVVRDLSGRPLRELPDPAWHVSPDGKTALTLDFARLGEVRPETGYAGSRDPRADDPAPRDDGIFLMDLETGRKKLVVSHREMDDFPATRRMPPGAKRYFTHPLFNPSGTRFMFWYRCSGGKGFYSAIYTAAAAGGPVRPVASDNSHSAWRGDDEILAWVRLPGEGGRSCLFRGPGPEREIFGGSRLDFQGHHDTFSPDGRRLLTDRGPDENNTRWLVFYEPASGRRLDVGPFASPAGLVGPLRCDLHPGWDRSGTRVCFDSTHEGLRGAYLLDVRGIPGQAPGPAENTASNKQ